jgi:RNA polymerase sigma factor (sigma-70 family)
MGAPVGDCGAGGHLRVVGGDGAEVGAAQPAPHDEPLVWRNPTGASPRVAGPAAPSQIESCCNLAPLCVCRTMDGIAVEGATEATPTTFAEFFLAEYQTLLRAMYLITGDPNEAEELAQDALVKACERWEQVGQMENPRGYIYRMAVNAHTSTIRKLRIAARRAISLNTADPISDSDDRDEIRRALATLPMNQREAIVFVEWLGLSDVEAGELFGVSAAAVRMRLSRAKASLREAVERADA